MGEGVGNWDGHKSLKQQYEIHGPILDQPVAGLLTDLRQRGLLATRSSHSSPNSAACRRSKKARAAATTIHRASPCGWRGAGVKPGFGYGATDEFGHKAIENICTIYDLHATILHLLGLDHERLSYYHNGIERRLTDVHGHVIREVLA
jgi:hypothetical protein